MKTCSCKVKLKPNKLEVLILLLATSIIPSSILAFLLLKNNNFNYFKFISYYFLIFLILITIFDFLLNKAYLALFFGCHGKKERSFKFIHKYFSLCARCSGIYLGIISFPLLLLFNFNYNYLLLFMIPLIIDGILQKTTSYFSNNFKRVLTGYLFGIAFIVLLSNIFYYYSLFIIYLSRLIYS